MKHFTSKLTLVLAAAVFQQTVYAQQSPYLFTSLEVPLKSGHLKISLDKRSGFGYRRVG